MFSVLRNPTDRELRWFGVLGMLFACGMAAWLTLQRGVHIWAVGLVTLGLLMGATGLSRPQWLRAIYVGWMRFVSPIGWLVGHLLLGVVYFGVLTPVGWAMRTCGHDPLLRRSDRTATTNWRPRGRQRRPSDYFRQF